MSARQKFAQLTAEPRDTLAPGFDRKLDAALKALAPILMDVSGVPVDYGVK